MNYQLMITTNCLLKILSRHTKKSNLPTTYTINAEAKVIAQDLKIDERIEQYNQKQSFITLKDHKDFKNNAKCRLINHVKCKIVIAIKEYIDRMNKTIRENQM